MSHFLLDLRFGLRQLAAKPSFAAAAILTLALGIGANTAVFSVLSGYLFKPLPYPDAVQLAEVNIEVPKLRAKPEPISLPLYRVIKKHTDAFSSTAFYENGFYYGNGTFNLSIGGRAQGVAGVTSSASLFKVLGVQPMLGRTFTADNMHPGSDHVAVISYGLWRTSFGSDPGAIGQTVKINGDVYRIIGVMPKGFAFPDHNATLWLPFTITPEAFAVGEAFQLIPHFIGRLKPGVSAHTAQAQVQHAVSTYIHDNVPAKYQKKVRELGFAMGVQPWRQVLLGGRPATLWLLQAAVALILLITCVNVANLLLSRILGRSHELAMRSALGASRSALARQLLIESVWLTLPGGLVGVTLAWLTLNYLVGSSFGVGQSIFNIALDWRVGLFALGTVLLTAALVSILPIRHLARTDLQLLLQEGGRTTSGGQRAKRARNALVIAELTLSTGLLAVAGLLLHSFMNLEAVDPGFRTSHVLMASLLVPRQDHSSDEALNSFYTNLMQRVEALPGVEQAATAGFLPLDENLYQNPFTIPGQTQPDWVKPPSANINFVSHGFFKVLGLPIVRGRQFEPRDAGEARVIIDEELAKKYFHGVNPIGRQIKRGDNFDKYTIIGVVQSIKYAKLSQPSPSATIYFNTDQELARVTNLVIRTAVPPSGLIKPLKNLVASIDPNVAVYNVHTMQEQLADSLRHKQTAMALLLAFGVIALALAIVGVYAVMSYAVGQRRAECGVRLALGALPEDLSWLILKDGLRLLAIGLVIGLGLAVLFGHLLSARLFGITPYDPVTLIGSALVLCVITTAACYLPARRAAKLDPTVAIMDQ